MALLHFSAPEMQSRMNLLQPDALEEYLARAYTETA